MAIEQSRSRSLSEAPVPRRSSALPPARRTSVHAELTTSSQTTFVRDESSLREPRDATIVTCLASPPKRHRTIRHALRWHETAQGTTRPPKAVRLARAFARRSAFSRVARARDGRSVDRASRAEAPFHATVPTPREAIGGQLGGPPHSIPTASRGRASARAEGHPGCSGSVLSRVRAALGLHAARALRLGALGVPGGPPPAHRSRPCASKPSAGACDVPAPAFPASVRGCFFLRGFLVKK